MLEPIVQHSQGITSVGTAGSSVTETTYKQGGGNELGQRYMTNLVITAGISLVTTPDTAALAQGILIYTFPAGQIVVNRIYGDVGLDINDAANVADTPEIGLGTVIATGSVATLGDAAGGITAENLWGPHVVAGCDTDADVTDAGQFVSTLDFIMAGAGAHLCHLNCADTWGNGAGTQDVTIINGRFIIEWLLLPIEGV